MVKHTTASDSLPYLHVKEGEHEMKKGRKDTLFGLIGQSRDYDLQRPLGGLITHTASGKKPSGLKRERVADATEHHIGGPNKSKIPGSHFGQVPYPGFYLYTKGSRV